MRLRSHIKEQGDCWLYDGGHAFDQANTHYRPNGGRTCKTCERAKVRRLRAQKKAAA